MCGEKTLCYVDDTAAMGVGAGPVEARNALAAEARRVAEEGKKAGLEFDPEKTGGYSLEKEGSLGYGSEVESYAR